MVSGGYHQQYRQGPPPAPQYQPSYGGQQRRAAPPPHQQQPYAGQEQYDDRYTGQMYRHEEQYTHGGSNGYYEEPYQYDQAGGHYQQQDYARQQESAYQYDERYRTGEHGRPQPSRGPHSHEQLPHQAMKNARSEAELRPRPRERERIIKPEPESPTTVPWDNPFGAFPPKKKQPTDEIAQTANELRNQVSSQDLSGQGGSRPRTSHGQPQQGRSRASQEQQQQQQQQPPRRSTGQQREQQQQQHPPPQSPGFAPRTDSFNRENSSQRYYNQDSRRPPPQRAMTGPVPQQPRQPQSSFGNNPSAQLQQRISEPRWAPEPQGSQMPYVEHTERHTGYRTHSPAPLRSPDNGQPYAYNGQPTKGPDLYGDHPPATAKATSATHYNGPISPDIPNFDAMTENIDENQIATTAPVKPAQPYRKATYDPHNSVDTAQGYQPLSIETEIVSPFADFSFDIPSAGASLGTAKPPYEAERVQHNMPYAQSTATPRTSNDTPVAAYPPRSASRGNMRPAPTQHYEEPLPSDSGYDQPANHYDSRQGQRPPRTASANQSLPPATHTPPQNGYRDEVRAGYDPRLQPRVNGTPQPYQQPPSRPHTSNSAHPSFNGHGRRPSSESYSTSIRSGVDGGLSQRPVPFRPGLMQAPAQSPSQVLSQPATPVNPPVQQQQRPPSTAKTAEKAAPVTPQELNTLRDACRSNPNDNPLALRFAKKLVEASKTLVTDNGRADPKQIAKNRERYVLDAHKVIKRLISIGYTEAMFYMADCYGQGLMGLQADPKEAFSLYQSAAKAGHPQSAYRVAVCCELGPEEGGGTRRDPLKATQWYKRAAALGDTPAMYKMGMIQLKGLLGQPRNPREAISWLKRAAERASEENPHALHELGLLYESAQSTDVIIRDEKYAHELFTQAADLGYKYSQFKLGSAYEYGLLGCQIDPRLSIFWYSRAAAQEEHQSEFALSGWYLTGVGQQANGQQPLLQQSDTEAYLWARRAASSGLAKAEYAMGYYTEVGIGVAANVEEAKKWYFRAAAQNHPKARERLEDLKKGGARMQKTRVSRSNVGRQHEGECTVM